MTPRLSAQQKREREKDAQTARCVAVAVAFATHFRVGPFEAYTIDAHSLAEARKRAAELNAAHGRYGRRAVVYAISARGSREPISDRIKA